MLNDPARRTKVQPEHLQACDSSQNVFSAQTNFVENLQFKTNKCIVCRKMYFRNLI